MKPPGSAQCTLVDEIRQEVNLRLLLFEKLPPGFLHRFEPSKQNCESVQIVSVNVK